MIGEGQIGEYEPVPFNGDAGLDRHRLVEHRAVVRAGVKLAALAARIDRAGQIVDQRRVELPAGEAPVDDCRVQARDARAQAAGDHVLREPRGVRRIRIEQREDRRQPRAREALFAVAADVLEKEIPERGVCEANEKSIRALFPEQAL